MKLKHIAIIGSLFPILFSIVLFFGVLISADSDDENSNFSSGITGMNLSAEVLKHQPMVEKYARENGISEYVNVLLASIERTLQTEDMEQMDESGKALAVKKHDIVFDDVHFSYESKEILHGINLQIPDKTTTAVIGPSGSGKTTLCNLIARFWDVNSGSVKIGGKDVRDYTLESLMEQISMVFQNVYLFADTIESNIPCRSCCGSKKSLL